MQTQASSQVRHRGLAVSVTLVALAVAPAVMPAGSPLAPSVAEAAVTSYRTTTSYVGGGTSVNVRSAPQLTVGNPDNTVYRLPTGAQLSIECQLVGGKLGFSQYSENRTWNRLSDGRYIHDVVTTSPGGPRSALADGGYVAWSSTIPRCASAPSSVRDRAVQAALATVGHRLATDTGDAGYFSAADWGPAPYGEWSGDCVKLPVAAYLKAGAGRIPSGGTAAQMYTNYRNAGLIRSGAAPAGALVFWPNIAAGYGHVALALGDGRVVSTDGMDYANRPNHIVGISHYGASAGWALPPGV